MNIMIFVELEQILCLGNPQMYFVPCNIQFVYFRSISGEEAAGDSEDDEKDSDTEEQEAPTDYVKGEQPPLIVATFSFGIRRNIDLHSYSGQR